MASYNKYTAAIEELLENINLQTDQWKIALASTINASDTTFTPGATDIVTGGGYTQGGNDANLISSSQSGGVYELKLSSPAIWTASGSGFSFRYAILWNSTTNTPVGYWDYGSTVSLNGSNGDTFEVVLDSVNGVFELS